MRFLTETVVPGHGLLAAVAALGCASGLLAETHTVDDDGPADFSTIQAAIDAASDGDEILVSPGVYTSASGDVVADFGAKQLIVRSTAGPEVTILAPSEGQLALYFYDEWGDVPDAAEIEGFTLRPSGSSSGASGRVRAISLSVYGKSVQVRNCVFANFSGYMGATRSDAFPYLSFTGCTFENVSGQIAIENLAAAGFNDCTFANSELTLRCAGIDIDDPDYRSFDPHAWMSIVNCRFIENRELRINYSTAEGEIRDCQFIGNEAPWAHVHAGIGSDLSVVNCSFTDFVGTGVSNNEAWLGVGGCTFRPRPGTASQCFKVGGEADPRGLLGGGLGDTTTAFGGCIFDGGSAANGGAGSISSSTSFDELVHSVYLGGCTFINNRASGNGGALEIKSSHVVILGCEFINNACSESGNAIYVNQSPSAPEGSIEVGECSFKNNDGSPGHLGAYTLYNEGMTIARCLDSNFCGSRIGHFGGDAIYDWGNLFADDCWENFPNPHGISFVSELDPWIWATVHSNGEMLQDFANAGPGDNAWATIDSPSHPSWAHAEAVGVVSDFQRLHNGMSYQLRTWGDLDAWSKNAGERMSCDADVYSDTLLVVKTEAVQVLDILMASGGAAEDHREWQNQAMFVEVRDTATMNPIAPVIEAYSDGWWRYELPADGEYWILTYVEVLSEISVEHDSNDPAGTRMTRAYEETYDVQMLFHIKGDVNGDGIVDGADLAALLGSWGTQNPDHDLNGDGGVDGGDLAMMLGSWGTP